MKTDVLYGILKTLSYFHVFQYPLTKDEIWKFLPIKCSVEEFNDALVYLEITGMVFYIQDYYCLHNEIKLINRRIKGNKLGKTKLKKAMLISRFLGAFPFVEAVCISGSLSKDFALKDSDLDFFIVTAPNRLWIARNIMHLFRKLTFLVNAQKSFCMNYYISMQYPEISPKNFYTAIELSTLKIAYAHKGIDELTIGNNSWVSAYLPNMDLQRNAVTSKNKKWIPTQCLEFLINKLNGDKIETFFYKTTIKRWIKKWNREKYDINECLLSTGPHVNTPLNFPVHLPENILKKYEMIYKVAELRYKKKASKFASKFQELEL